MVESLTPLCAIALVLAVVDGKPTTTSLDIARHFGKRHDDVLRLIRNLLPQLPADALRNFAEGFYTLPNTGEQQHPMYRITRDGFTLLAMGFTGKKALQFKLAYIDAFNQLEAELSSKPKQLPNALRQITAPTPPEPPTIDVRELLLSGQTSPAPLTPAQQALVDEQAWRMAGDAYQLAREHITRAIAYQTLPFERADPKNPRIANIVKSITLNKALTHTYWAEARSLQKLADGALWLAQQNLSHINDLLAGKGKPPDVAF